MYKFVKCVYLDNSHVTISSVHVILVKINAVKNTFFMTLHVCKLCHSAMAISKLIVHY